MFSILPCTCFSFCQADSTCDRLPRFQVRLDAQHPRIHRSAESCASHLGTMVVAMATWAREKALISTDLTILIIEPPSYESRSRLQPRSNCVQTLGLVFSIIHLREQGRVPAGLCPATSDISYQDSGVPLAAPGHDEPVRQRLLTVAEAVLEHRPREMSVDGRGDH
jgi:hypothetical protein